MAQIVFNVKNPKPVDQAITLLDKKIKKRMSDHSSEFTIKDAKWERNIYILDIEVQGIKIKGKLTVKEKTINADFEVPMIVLPFKAQAIELITKEITEAFE